METIDAIQELQQNNNPIPILAVIDKIDINMKINDIPLISILCTKYLPLGSIMENIVVKFTPDKEGRTALHYAITADDVQAAEWCITHGCVNSADNIFQTPILNALRLGHKRCFILCLKYNFFDSRAPLIAAAYNRAWQLKIMYTLKQNVINVKDQYHCNALQIAVANCNFQSAKFLCIIDRITEIKNLKLQTDSKGIIRTIQKERKQTNELNTIYLPFLSQIIRIIIFFIGIIKIREYEIYTYQLLILLNCIVILDCLMLILGIICRKQADNYNTSNNAKLTTVLINLQRQDYRKICPYCIKLQNKNEDHCWKCGECIQKWHFHQGVCVNVRNEVAWIVSEFIWLYLTYELVWILIDELTLQSLALLKLRGTFWVWFYIIQYLFYNRLLLQGLFRVIWWVSITVFLFYQILSCIQIIAMLVMHRTYQQIIHTENYPQLYRVIKMKDSTYRSQEIRIFQYGFCPGIFKACWNVLRYFLYQS